LSPGAGWRFSAPVLRIDAVDSPHPGTSLVVRNPVRRFYQNQKKIKYGKSDKADVYSGARLSLRPPAINPV